MPAMKSAVVGQTPALRSARALLQEARSAPNVPAAAAEVFRRLAPTPEVAGHVAQLVLESVSPSTPSHFRHMRPNRWFRQDPPTPLANYLRSPDLFARQIQDLSTTDVQHALDGVITALPRWDKGLPQSLADVMTQVDALAREMLSQLARGISFRGVSHDDTLWDEVRRTASEWVTPLLQAAGPDRVTTVTPTGGLPTVYAVFGSDPAKETVWLYSHHDDQPADPKEWRSNPWVAHASKGRLFGRGASDDKAGFIAALTAIMAYRNAGIPLPVNVVAVVEGEEEIGSIHIGEVLPQIDAQPPDLLLAVDGWNLQSGRQTATIATRGLVQCEMAVRTVAMATHAGGNSMAPGASTESAWIVAQLMDVNRRLYLPGFTDREIAIPEVFKASAAAVTDVTYLRRAAGMPEGMSFVVNSEGHPLLTTWCDWAIHLLAHQGQDLANVAGIIVPEARSVVQVRIPPGVDAAAVEQALYARIQSLLWKGATVGFSKNGSIPAWLGDTDAPAFGAIQSAVMQATGEPLLVSGCGGSIGFLQPFVDFFPGKPVYVWGIEDPETNAHGPNENQGINALSGTARTLAAILWAMGHHAEKS
ncbi:MAG: M20/M25/M40 family metallo-hydrolase [Deltaproteobacteria bacterium]|nr:M20/M25/M40 family metallo-hydrolase [Deltaproteobacteria bacterium]